MELVVNLIFCDEIFGVISTLKFGRQVDVPKQNTKMAAPYITFFHGLILVGNINFHSVEILWSWNDIGVC